MNETVLDGTEEVPQEESGGRKTYNKSYYDEHADEIAERRKRKYEEDPEYRKERLEAARKYREKKQREREKKATRRGKEYVRRRGGPRKPVEVEVNGEMELAYTISTLAKKSKRSLATIRSWRAKGIFPVTPFQTARGDTLYTMPMIKTLCSVLRQYARMASDSAFRSTVESKWEDMGIPVGETVVVSR